MPDSQAARPSCFWIIRDRQRDGMMTSKAQKLYDAALKAQNAGRLSVAITKYQACLKMVPASGPALNNLGYCLMSQHRYDVAARFLRKAELVSPKDPTVLGNLAACCLQLRDYQGACKYLRRRGQLGGDVDNLRLLITACRAAGKPDEALAVARQVAERQDATLADLSNMLHLAREVCDWDCLTPLSDNFFAAKLAASPEYAGSPFRYYSHLECSDLLKQVAMRAAQNVAHPEPTSASDVASDRRLTADEPLRIGFVSQDFRDHPMLKLVAGLLMSGKDCGADIHLYAVGPGSDDRRRDEIKKNAKVFREFKTQGAEKIAEVIKRDDLHALVDLMGYTRDAMPEILALRPCDVQITWLGLPGTTGAPWIDYVIADETVIPKEDEAAFTEKVLRLHPTYYPFDDRSARKPPAVTRADQGLPADGFVFASFNQPFKFGPDRFGTWCAALGATPGSVLWVLEPSGAAKDNLRRAAAAHGVDPDRIVFAPRVSHEDHYARIGLADLMLDTWLYGGHTTTIDALWSGTPVVTRIGPTFTSRVAASILKAANLDDLIVATEDEYLKLATKIAGDASFRAALVARCKDLDADAPPFSTSRFSAAFFGEIRSLVAGR